MEVRYGGVVFDNSTTNYAARVGRRTRSVMLQPLTGRSNATAVLGYLSLMPRVKANAAAVAKMNSVYQLQGKIEVPTIHTCHNC